MNNYEEIKQALANNDTKKAMLIAFSNSINIKLKTTLKKEQESKANIESNLNLIRGLTTEIDPEILDKQFQDIINFHQQQVDSVYETWQKNRETLLKIWQLLSGNLTDIGKIKSKISLINQNISYSQNIPTSSEEKNIDNDRSRDDDLDLINEKNRDRINREYNYSEEEIYEYQINNLTINDEESSIIFQEDIPENWVDEILNNDDDEFPEEETPTSLESELEFGDFFSSSTGLQKEAMTEEEVEIEVETVDEENWDDMGLDWQDEVENAEAMATMMETETTLNQESSPSLEVDDWREWLDENDLSIDEDNDDGKNIDWNQEDWQNAQN